MSTELETNLRYILNEKTNKIIPENIKKNIEILGVTGTYEGSGGTLQEKSVTITQNGTQTITPDTGYDGMSEIEINTNVPVYLPDWQQIGYSETPEYILDVFNYSKKIYDEWDSSKTNIYQKYMNDNSLIFMPLVDTSNVRIMGRVFSGCTKLLKVPLLNTSNVNSSMQEVFSQCSSLKELPLLDTKNVTAMNRFCYMCSNLVTVPEWDTTNVSNMQYMFDSCSKLSNDSLNNILAMCANSAVTTNKTLKYIGLSSAQATTCQSLSNYQAFLDAGWTTGY